MDLNQESVSLDNPIIEDPEYFLRFKYLSNDYQCLSTTDTYNLFAFELKAPIKDNRGFNINIPICGYDNTSLGRGLFTKINIEDDEQEFRSSGAETIPNVEPIGMSDDNKPHVNEKSEGKTRLTKFAVKKEDPEKPKNLTKPKNLLTERKFKRDSVQKRILSHFFKTLFKEHIQPLLRKKKKVKNMKANQEVVRQISVKQMKVTLESSLKMIYEGNNPNYLDLFNPKKNEEVQEVLNKKIKEFYSEYLNSKNYRERIIELAKIEEEEYVILFKVYSEELIDYFSKSKPNQTKN